MSALERADTIPLEDFTPHSADEDIRNLRQLRETVRRFGEEGHISMDQLMERVRSLPGHRELKDTIEALLTTTIQLDFAVETIMDSILMEISDVSPPLAEVMVQSDSEPEWSALYEDISDDELADMSTDEEDEEDDKENRPPVARRLEFLKLRL